MAIKLKNITKTKKLPVLRSKKKSISILTYISVFILIITGILLILFARNGIYRDALSETEYGRSAAYARQIRKDIKKICSYENNAVDGAKKSKEMGRDFSYLYAKMYISENVDIFIDHEACNNEINLKMQQLSTTIKQNKLMLQTYNIQRKDALTKCITEKFDTSTTRVVAVSNNTNLIHSDILETNGYDYEDVFDYETGDSAVILLIYNTDIFNAQKSQWQTLCTCIKIITTLAVISALYLLYIHLFMKGYITFYAKALRKFLHNIRIFITGHIYYPLCTKKGVKFLFISSTILVALIAVFLIIFTMLREYFINLIPVGYSLNTLSDWVPDKWYNLAYYVTSDSYCRLCCGCFVIYVLIFAIYHYFSSKVISSCSLLEKDIDEIYNGNYKFDTADAADSTFYESILKLSNIGAGFEKSLAEKVKSERMKTELITNVSHDLKTPLTSIISYVDLLERRDDLPPEAVDYIEIISKKAIHLKKMVFDVFELAKTASGELVIKKTNLSLNKLIVQTLTDMDDAVQKSGLDIKLKMPEKDIFINSDGSRLYRVMQNIIGNALKYSLKGTRIFITETTEESTVKLILKNTSSYEMDFTEEEILERFSRGDKARNTEGNGLGLSIAKEFTNACGGTFKIKIDGDQFNVIIVFPIAADKD